MANNLDQLAKTVDDKQAAFDKAAQELSDARDAHVEAKVSAMDPKLVKEAQDWGLNPANFEDDAHLQDAINLASRSREQAKPADQTEGEAKPGAMSEADAA